MLPKDFKAIDWSSDGKFIIIGTLTGLIYYVDENNLKRNSPFKSIFFGETSSKKNKKKLKMKKQIPQNGLKI